MFFFVLWAGGKQGGREGGGGALSPRWWFCGPRAPVVLPLLLLLSFAAIGWDGDGMGDGELGLVLQLGVG